MCSGLSGACTTPADGATPVTTGLLLAVLLVAQGDTAAINRYVQSELERQHIPGLSLAVLTGDRVRLSRGYRFANVELHVPASDSTVYQS